MVTGTQRAVLGGQILCRAAVKRAQVARRMGAVPAVNAHDIKLIASDVDGTLMRSDQEFSPHVQETIAASVKLGVPLVVATGKNRGPWSKKLLPLLGPPIPGVFSNGLILADGEGNTIYSRDMDRQPVLEGIELAHELGLTFTAYSFEKIYSEVINEDTDRLVFYGEPHPEPIDDLAERAGVDIPVQKYILLATPEHVQNVRGRIEEHFAGRAHLTTALPGMLEVLPVGASKGDGLRRLLEHLNIDPKDVMAIGDGENDVEMFKLVGLSVAMANAVTPAREAADEIIGGTNDEDGVAMAIQKFVLEPRGAMATT